MTEIPPYPLWIGHLGEASDFRRVFDAGIKALVHLAAEETPPQPPRELIVVRVPLNDGGGNRSDLLALAIRATAALLEMRLPTLVCCGAGMSRSPAVAAAALALAHREPPEETLKRVIRHHPGDVSPGLWLEIKGVLGTLGQGGPT